MVVVTLKIYWVPKIGWLGIRHVKSAWIIYTSHVLKINNSTLSTSLAPTKICHGQLTDTRAIYKTVQGCVSSVQSFWYLHSPIKQISPSAVLDKQIYVQSYKEKHWINVYVSSLQSFWYLHSYNRHISLITVLDKQIYVQSYK